MDKARIGLNLHTLNHLIRRYLDFSSRKKGIADVTGNHGWIIGYLSHNTDKDIYQKDLERQFTITRSTVSRVLSLMEENDLIKRVPVDHDARLKKIVLTDKAYEIDHLMREDRHRMEQIITEGFTDEELIRLSSFLDRMKENISQHTPTTPTI